MTKPDDFEIFLAAAPGLEPVLRDEAVAGGFAAPTVVPGGVTIQGGWPEVWRANLELRGPSHVLARIDSFRALHLAQLDKRARKVAWGKVLRADMPFRVEASCRASRIYHSDAAAQRIRTAIVEELGAPAADDAEVCVKLRIEDNVCTVSIDTSGEILHKRGHKEAIAKAPMRETLAALFLRQCGYDGHEPVLDPLCGSGTFVIEAAEIARGLKPGRSRRFAFEQLATFDADAWARLRDGTAARDVPPGVRFHGSDRDAGAVEMAQANAARAGVADLTDFRRATISDVVAPDGPPGLVIANPPYGTRIGDRKKLYALYGALGRMLAERFRGWRVGIVTNDAALAGATGLPFAPPTATVSHGGLRVMLFLTGPL